MILKLSLPISVGLVISLFSTSCAYDASKGMRDFSPNGLARHLNHTKWSDASKNVFTELRDCTERRGVYVCSGGWLASENPQGKKVCSITSAYYNIEQKASGFQTENCRWVD